MTLVAHGVSVVEGKHRILGDVSLTLEAGKVVGLVGPNGAGKSTLLRLMSGELTPSDGTVEFKSTNLRNVSLEELAQLRTVMSQSDGMSFDYRVEEVLEMGWVQARRWGQNKLDLAISDVVNECELEDLIGRKYRTLSGGERQRVQFARSLVQIWRPFNDFEPRYMLLDEPTSSMDLAYELKLLRTVRKMTGRGLGVLVVLHDLNLAGRFVDEVVLLNRGSVVSAGLPVNVLADDVLTSVYRTPIFVENSESLSRLVIHT